MPSILCLVIPCFNDASRLASFLPELCDELKSSPLPTVITIVDDGSLAKEKAALEIFVEKMREQFSFVQPVIHQTTNQGKGAAIMRGWLGHPDATWYGFLDADGAIPFYEVVRLIHRLKKHSAKNISLFSSRIKMRGKKISRSAKRHYSGRIFASVVGALIDKNIYDSQCGFKIIPQEAYQKISPHLQEKRFAFDVELLALLNHFGFSIEEIPIDWNDISGSKVSLVSDTINMLRAVLAIRSKIKSFS